MHTKLRVKIVISLSPRMRHIVIVLKFLTIKKHFKGFISCLFYICLL